MRLFIAIPVPEQVKDALLKAQEQMMGSARLTPAKEFHLTLKFLGETEEKDLEEVKNRLEQVKVEKFDAFLNGIGVFPDEKMIRVVWAGVEPHEKITALQKEIENSLRGLFPEDSRFHPHITLARAKPAMDSSVFAEQLRKIEIAKTAFPVGSFSLIRSTLTPAGPVYATVKTFGRA